MIKLRIKKTYRIGVKTKKYSVLLDRLTLYFSKPHFLPTLEIGMFKANNLIVYLKIAQCQYPPSSLLVELTTERKH